MKCVVTVASCFLVFCIAQVLSLECLSCKGRGMEHPCGLPIEAGQVNRTVFDSIVCPEVTGEEQEQGIRAVCMKVVTVHDSYAGEGAVSSRYCDKVDYADSCWWEDGGTTDTEFCACSDEDNCNSAMATATSLATTAAAILFAKFVL